MKKSFLALMLLIMLCSCSSLNRMCNEAILHAIIGQDESTVRSRVGLPERIIKTADGGQKFIYELHYKGMFTTPNKSKLTLSYSGDIANPEPHLDWEFSSIETKTNAPNYTIYRDEISLFEVLLNEDGECVSFHHNMSRDQMEQFYQRFKRYIPEVK